VAESDLNEPFYQYSIYVKNRWQKAIQIIFIQFMLDIQFV